MTLTGGTIPANGSCVLTVEVVAANGGSYINTLAAGDLDDEQREQHRCSRCDLDRLHSFPGHIGQSL